MSKTKQKLDQNTIHRVLKLIRPYTGMVILTLTFALITVVTTLLAPVLSGKAVDMILGPGQVDFAGLGKIAIAMAATIACTALAQWLMNVVNNRITFQVVRDMRVRAFDQLEILPLKYMDAHRPGDAISRITTDVEQFSDGLLMGFTQLFTGLLTILGTLGVMLFIDWRIALVVVALTPLSIFVARFIATHTYSMFKVQSETRAEMTSLVEELVGNEHLVRAFGYERRAEERFDKINLDLQKCGVKATFFSSTTYPCSRFVNALVYAAVGVLGAFVAIAGGITVGQLSVFLNYANQYTKPFNDISDVMTELQNALACAQRVFDLIDETPIVPDGPDAVALPHGAGSVKFDHVRFRYVDDVPLIEDMNLKVAPGQRIALVGPTGCGKTTLVNLLMRFYELNSGSILIGRHDILDFTRNDLRSMFGMVLLLCALGMPIYCILDNIPMIEMPKFIGCLFAGAIARNVMEAAHIKFYTPEVDALEHMFLELYLALVLMTIDITALADVAGQMGIILLLQAALMALFAIFVSYNMFGRNYGAAVMAAGKVSPSMTRSTK